MELVVNNGKPVEPSKVKKAIAAVTNDKEVSIEFPHFDIQAMIVNKLWNESPWLSKYNRGSLQFDSKTNTFRVVFKIAEE